MSNEFNPQMYNGNNGNGNSNGNDDVTTTSTKTTIMKDSTSDCT